MQNNIENAIATKSIVIEGAASSDLSEVKAVPILPAPGRRSGSAEQSYREKS
jgi:hypothetical protein